MRLLIWNTPIWIAASRPTGVYVKARGQTSLVNHTLEDCLSARAAADIPCGPLHTSTISTSPSLWPQSACSTVTRTKADKEDFVLKVLCCTALSATRRLSLRRVELLRLFRRACQDNGHPDLDCVCGDVVSRVRRADGALNLSPSRTDHVPTLV